MILTTFNMIVGLQNLSISMPAPMFLVRVRKILQVIKRISLILLLCDIGLGLKWITPPNSTVFLGETFNVSYQAIISASFYDNMANSIYFPNIT